MRKKIGGILPMIALGIDLSLTGTGLVAVEGNELHFSERFEPKAKSGPERLEEIQDAEGQYDFKRISGENTCYF